MVSGAEPVMCESVKMKKECPERKPWLCHSGNDLIFETCTACGAGWRFWQDVSQKKTVITGYHQGGTAKDRAPGRCETCHVMWKEARWNGGHDGDEIHLEEKYDAKKKRRLR